MKVFNYVFMACFLFLGGAQAQVAADTSAKREAKLRAWLQAMDESDGKVWLTESRPQVKATNERAFLEAVGATGSGNGGDPVAMNFVDMAKYAIGCGLLESLPSREADILNRSFYSIRVFSVPFNLCVDDTADCDFETSFTAKNFPDRNLILVNAVKWNLISTEQRMTIALHEVLGLLGLEKGTYGRSTSLRLRSSQRTDGTSFSIENRCYMKR